MQLASALRRTGTPPVPPGAVDFGATRYVKRTLTAAEVAALLVTPIAVLIAQGEGMVILPLACVVEKEAGTPNAAAGQYRLGTSTSNYDAALSLDHAGFSDSADALKAVMAEMPSGTVGDDPTDAAFNLCSNAPLLFDSDHSLAAADFGLTLHITYLVLAV